jgi:DNA-binding NarL/FixJ family response regulator
MTTLTDYLPTVGSAVTTVLLVDDHPLFRKGLKELLETETSYKNCYEANTITEAIEAFHKYRPGLVTIDISLNGENGLLLVDRLRQESPTVAILVISMHHEDFYLRRTLEAGGNGYICKQANHEDLLEAINCVSGGGNYTKAVKPPLFKTAKSSPPNVEQAKLSARELQILGFIGEGMTTQSIANNLRLAPTTVETYRERIKSKLKLANSTELNRYAILWRLENP